MTLLPRFLSLVFFLLACFVLPQQAAAQQTPPVVEISFDDDLVQEEGTVFRFTVNLSAALLEARTFNIAYSTFDPSSGIYDPATLATDLGSDRPTTLTIPTGVTEVTFDVPTVQDNIAEKPEVFSVALSVPTPFPTNPRNLLVLDARANNTILDNDSAAIQIFSQRSGRASGVPLQNHHQWRAVRKADPHDLDRHRRHRLGGRRPGIVIDVRLHHPSRLRG